MLQEQIHFNPPIQGVPMRLRTDTKEVNQGVSSHLQEQTQFSPPILGVLLRLRTDTKGVNQVISSHLLDQWITRDRLQENQLGQSLKASKPPQQPAGPDVPGTTVPSYGIFSTPNANPLEKHGIAAGAQNNEGNLNIVLQVTVAREEVRTYPIRNLMIVKMEVIVANGDFEYSVD
ncbi:hypothetical protein SLEP1_g33637 [Rubroshorea leprosula]|uniref:Uncharacterized protein n=1 Tax=Rubroshorea leprosula TaxID=152421 RepID=A0AAV5KH84_9ROSI|nr:hypothetical protein SLEP1_g33637 [Rubroshorea leprosula]